MGCRLLVCLRQGMVRAVGDRLLPHGNLCKAALTLEDVTVKWAPVRQCGIVRIIEQTGQMGRTAASRKALSTRGEHC